jgi:hypothetical protein
VLALRVLQFWMLSVAGGVVECHNSLLLWPWGHSRLYVVVAAGVTFYRRVPYLISCWCVRWVSGLSGII